MSHRFLPDASLDTWGIKKGTFPAPGSGTCVGLSGVVASSLDSKEGAVAADRADTAAADIADTAAGNIADTAADIADTAAGNIADTAADIADTAAGNIADTAAADIADIAAGNIADTAGRTANATDIASMAKLGAVRSATAALAGLRCNVVIEFAKGRFVTLK